MEQRPTPTPSGDATEAPRRAALEEALVAARCETRERLVQLHAVAGMLAQGENAAARRFLEQVIGRLPPRE
jgi:hypothetical protein